VKSPKYPNTVYEVIWQPYQYSWTHDDKSDIPENKELFREILNFVRQQDPYNLQQVTHYHEVGVIPEWTNRLAFLGRVGNHLTYREI
jgi:spore germination cell wall hydrolase CwlJ-like protein